eukprot:1501877-Prymnesium_polylepis.1
MAAHRSASQRDEVRDTVLSGLGVEGRGAEGRSLGGSSTGDRSMGDARSRAGSGSARDGSFSSSFKRFEEQARTRAHTRERAVSRRVHLPLEALGSKRSACAAALRWLRPERAHLVRRRWTRRGAVLCPTLTLDARSDAPPPRAQVSEGGVRRMSPPAVHCGAGRRDSQKQAV